MEKFTTIINENTTSKQKIGIDIHGVIDALPDFFAFLTESFIKNGGEVHVITGGTFNEQLEAQIKSANIKYTHVFSVYDHLIETNASTYGDIVFPDGTIQKKFKDDVWDSAKADYCKRNDISLHIDDTLIYNEHFTTPFARLWSHNNKQKARHKSIRHVD